MGAPRYAWSNHEMSDAKGRSLARDKTGCEQPGQSAWPHEIYALSIPPDMYLCKTVGKTAINTCPSKVGSSVAVAMGPNTDNLRKRVPASFKAHDMRGRLY